MKDEGEVTTTISIDKATHKALRLLAVHRETTVRDLIREAIADFLKRQGGSRK